MRILVTDSEAVAGLGAVRSLGRAGHIVTAGYSGDLERPPATYSRYCDGAITHPDPWACQHEFRDWLSHHASKFDLVLPVVEASVMAASACEASMEGRTKLAIPSPSALNITLSKQRSTKHAMATGLRCAPAAFSMEDIEQLDPPYILRTDNRLMPDGTYKKGKTWYLRSRQALDDMLRELEDGGYTWVAQECIPGHGLGASILQWDARMILGFAHERVHETPFFGGISTLRKSIEHPELLGAASKMLAAMDYKGLAMVEFRKCAATGTEYFVEINGRLWGSLALALHAGVDFPKVAVDCYAGSPLPDAAPTYKAGLHCRLVFPEEAGYVLSVLKARGKEVRGVVPPSRIRALASFFGWFFSPSVRYDYFWPSDWRPWVMRCIGSCVEIGRSQWQKLVVKRRRRKLVQRVHLKQQSAKPDLSRVLFLCFGNICRSSFAEFIWNADHHDHAPARSAGFVPNANRRTPTRISKIARELGVDLSEHRSKRVDREMIDEATSIFVMDGRNLDDLLTEYPEAESKTWLLGSFAGTIEIADPYSLPDDRATESLEIIAASIRKLSPKGCADETRSG